MAKKKSTSSADRHKPARMVRIRNRQARYLDQVAKERGTSFTEEANRAIREMAERDGRWLKSDPLDSSDDDE